MNAGAFRYLYDYHFAENRGIWDRYILSLTDEEFTREAGYSYGSVRNQIVHLINTDDGWFAELRGVEAPKGLDPVNPGDRVAIRAHWDNVEHAMRGYLAGLRDDMLFAKPLEGEDKDLIVWQVLLHVVNHGTDHRAQLLRLLNDLGTKTTSQDFVFYVYDHIL